MPFIGNQPALSYTSFAKQDFTTSATTSYTLSQPVANENEIALFINFVRQEPTTAYTASGTSLTLTSATSASDDMYAIFLGKAVQTVNPPAGSVGTSQLADASVTSAKLASGVGGKVLQVVNTLSQSTQLTTSTSYIDITELTDIAITPSISGNKILIQLNIACFTDSSARLGLDLQLKIGAGSYSSLIADTEVFKDTSSTGNNSASYSLNYLYTTSSTDVHYIKLMMKTNTGTAGLNDAGASSITLTEIAS